MTTDEAIVAINKLGYLIQMITQVTPNSWQVTVRSPYCWDWFHGHGATLPEAATKAATAAGVLGRAIDHPNALNKRHGTRSKRVKLKRERVKLNEKKPKQKRIRLGQSHSTPLAKAFKFFLDD